MLECPLIKPFLMPFDAQLFAYVETDYPSRQRKLHMSEMAQRSSKMHMLNVVHPRKKSAQQKILRKSACLPNSGPIARPSCPDERKRPRAWPFASSGSWIAFNGFPLPAPCAAPSSPASGASSHCNDACAVRALTTVAEVIAMHTAAPCSSRNAKRGRESVKWGTSASATRPIAQLYVPRRAILSSPTRVRARRT
jgi:hypothetical protein